MLGRTTRRALVVALGCCVATAIAASPASAIPPANDPFAAPVNLPGVASNTVNGTTIESTLEAGEDFHYGAGGSVWYTWTATTAGTTSFSTCTSDGDPTISVYTGAALNALVEVTANDDGCDPTQGNNGLGSIASFTAAAGTTYRIAVVAFDADEFSEGTFTLLGPQAPPPPIVTPVTPATPAVPTVTPAIPASPAASKKCKKGFKKVKGKCKKIKKKKQ